MCCAEPRGKKGGGKSSGKGGKEKLHLLKGEGEGKGWAGRHGEEPLMVDVHGMSDKHAVRPATNPLPFFSC